MHPSPCPVLFFMVRTRCTVATIDRKKPPATKPATDEARSFARAQDASGEFQRGPLKKLRKQVLDKLHAASETLTKVCASLAQLDNARWTQDPLVMEKRARFFRMPGRQMRHAEAMKNAALEVGLSDTASHGEIEVEQAKLRKTLAAKLRLADPDSFDGERPRGEWERRSAKLTREINELRKEIAGPPSKGGRPKRHEYAVVIGSDEDEEDEKIAQRLIDLGTDSGPFKDVLRRVRAHRNEPYRAGRKPPPNAA